MTDRTTKQVIEGIESAIIDWELDGDYRGYWDEMAQQTMVDDIRALLEITKTALETTPPAREPSASTADLPAPPTVVDSPEARMRLLYLAGRVAEAAGKPEVVQIVQWGALADHAHGLLVASCNRYSRTPSWWLEETMRVDARFPERHLRKPLPYVTHRIADVLSSDTLRADWLAEITLTAYAQSGDLK